MPATLIDVISFYTSLLPSVRVSTQYLSMINECSLMLVLTFFSLRLKPSAVCFCCTITLHEVQNLKHIVKLPENKHEYNGLDLTKCRCCKFLKQDDLYWKLIGNWFRTHRGPVSLLLKSSLKHGTV